jgi:hypothetical protein
LEDFLQLLPDPAAVASNKIVYFLVEEAVLPGTLASKYVRQAPLWDGHGAYVLLYNGFVFSGPQTATVLMAELSTIRFHAGETGSAFCLRLVELLEDLEHIPGTSAVCLNDTQKLGYLLSAIRHERDLNGVYVQLQTDQLRGKVTFEQACQELHFRCEAIRADALLDSRYKPTGKALISTEIKHLDKAEKLPCLVKDCEGMIVAFLPLCKGCFLQCKSGKTPILELRDGLGNATYNAKTERVEFPPGVPKSRLPGGRRPKGVRKGLVFQVAVGTTALVSLGAAEGVRQEGIHGGEARTLVPYGSSFTFMESVVTASPDEAGSLGATVRCLMAGGALGVTFFVDSGAGQCLCSVSSAFSDLQPCRVEVTGVSGSLPIFGWGTANFVATDHDGNPLVIVIPNCLYGQCEFNLLSVSQVHQVRGNHVDFSLASPEMVLVPPPGVHRSTARIPLVLEDGLFALRVEPLGEGDPRFEVLPKYVVTQKGKFVPSDAGTEVRWRTKVLGMGSSSARMLAGMTEDCHDNLATFCDQYLAPPSIPPARRLYDVRSQADMTQLSIRFLGASTDRLIRTVEISNGLKSPASKQNVRVPPLVFP